MIQLFNYIERVSPIHKLTGASKMACMLCWVLAAMSQGDRVGHLVAYADLI